LKASELAARLQAKQAGDWYRTQCPVHNGQRDSLTFRDGDYRIVFKCHAGCSDHDIHEHFKASLPGYCDTKRGAANRTGDALRKDRMISDSQTNVNNNQLSIKTLDSINGPWVYLDQSGTPVLKVERYLTKGSKSYAQFHWDSNRWVKGAAPGKTPLYNFSSIATSTRQLLITEGEKACHAAMKLFPECDCTCWPQGANNWKKANWDLIKGRDAVLWPDNDAPGVKAMGELAEHLRDLGCLVYVVDVSSSTLPDKWDLADPVPDGVDIHDLFRNAAPAPNKKYILQEIRSIDLMRMEFPPPRMLVDELIPEGLTIIAAPPKIGKSFFAEDLACCIATGREFLGKKTEKLRTLYIDAEQTPQLIKRRMMALKWDQGADGLTYSPVSGITLDEKTLEAMKPQVKGRFDVLIVDTLARLCPQSRGGGDAYQKASDQLGPLHAWCLQMGVSVIVIHHTRKGAESDSNESYDDMTGGRGYMAVADTLITFRRIKDNNFKVSITGRVAEGGEYLLEKDGVRWTMHGEYVDESVTDERKAIMNAMEKLAKPATAPEIAEIVGKQVPTVAKALKRMAKYDLIRNPRRGVYQTITSALDEMRSTF